MRPHSLRLWIENSKEDQLVEALLERYFSTQVAEVLRHTEVSKICLIYTYNMSNLCFGKYSDEKFLKFRCAIVSNNWYQSPGFYINLQVCDHVICINFVILISPMLELNFIERWHSRFLYNIYVVMDYMVDVY